MDTPKTNGITFEDVMEAMRELGGQAGKGKDTQIKSLLKVLEAGYHNAMDLKPNKHGKDIDDATLAAEAYVKAQGSAAVFDAKAMNQRKLISTLRTAIKLGQWPKGGNGEPLATVNNLISMRQKLRQNPTEIKKLDDAANTFLRYSRQQIKLDQLMNDAQLKDVCYKPVSPERTAEQIIEAARDQLTKLIKGEAANGTAQDNSAHILTARNALTDRLKQIAILRGAAKGPTLAAAFTPV